MNLLLTPHTKSVLHLKNHLVMAPMTRSRAITDAVHASGSKIFLQLMHTGRIGHPFNLPAGARSHA